MSGSRLLFSAAEDFLAPATEELREVFPDAAFGAVGSDLGWIAAEGLSIGALADACRECLDQLGETVGGVEFAPVMFDGQSDIEEARDEGRELPAYLRVQTYKALYRIVP